MLRKVSIVIAGVLLGAGVASAQSTMVAPYSPAPAGTYQNTGAMLPNGPTTGSILIPASWHSQPAWGATYQSVHTNDPVPADYRPLSSGSLNVAPRWLGAPGM